MTKMNRNEVADELDICHLTKLVSKVFRCRLVKTLVPEHCIFECNPLWSL